MRTLLTLGLLLVLALVAPTLGPAHAEDHAMADIAVGDTPGAFALNDEKGKAVRLGGAEDHGWFVLAFYPKALTGG